MRILMLTPQLPYPPRQGTALRNWGILSNLARNHEVWLLSFDEQTPAGAIAPELQAACRRVAAFPVPRRSTAERLRRVFTSPLPDMAWRLWDPAFAARFDEWVTNNHFDIIQIEGIELARYALEPATSPGRGTAGNPHKFQSSRQSLPDSGQLAFIFDDHNCEYLLQRRAFETDARQPRRWHAAAYSFVQWQRLRVFERRAARTARATLCVSPQDVAALTQLDAAIRPRVIFNGIDVASYASYSSSEGGAPEVRVTRQSKIENRKSKIENPTLVFTGKMDFRPNIDAMLWFGREVFPLIQQSFPQARLLIMGQRPSPRLNVLRADPNVTLTGAVDDQRLYIAQADVYIAPLRVGGGTRFKLLEAMAMGRPIVSTTLGCEGFAVTAGQELMIGDTPAAFAAAVVQVLGDEALRLALVRRARAFVSSAYDWGVIVPKLERVYKDVLNLKED